MTIEATRNKHMKKPLQELFFYAETPVLNGQIVMMGATEGTIVPCTANANPIGICFRTVTQETITSVDTDGSKEGAVDLLNCPVCIIGIAPVLAGAELTMNQWVISDADGRAVPATLDGTDNIIGICLDAATGDEINTHIQIHRIPATDQA